MSFDATVTGVAIMGTGVVLAGLITPRQSEPGRHVDPRECMAWLGSSLEGEPAASLPDRRQARHGMSAVNSS